MWQFNIVCFPNGRAGLNAEHSYADALTVAHMWEWCTTGERLEGYTKGNEHAVGWDDSTLEQVKSTCVYTYMCVYVYVCMYMYLS